jgi:hypothetical protein
MRIDVEDRDKLFGAMLQAARGDSIAIDSAHRRTFVGISAAVSCSDL